MEAKAADSVPAGPEWQYEPKWDGFRCLAFRDGATVELQSKAGEPLARYFPEMVEAMLALGAPRLGLDGELVIPKQGSLSFDDLLMRIHPAESRIRRLAAETPALLIVFDLLIDEKGRSLVAMPLAERRQRLEVFAARLLAGNPRFALSPATRDRDAALRWFESTRGTLDGVVAKRIDLPYRSGDRTGMQKIKLRRTADCVVGGFRYATSGGGLGSLLLGLYDEQGVLHHVGFTSSLKESERRALLPKLRKLIGAPGFTGRAPGGPSRWNRGRSSEWQPLLPKLVVEVEYDHVTGERFRHGTRFVRWRPDKAPRQCTFEQIARPESKLLDLLGKRTDRGRSVRRSAKKRRSPTAGTPRAAAKPSR